MNKVLEPLPLNERQGPPIVCFCPSEKLRERAIGRQAGRKAGEEDLRENAASAACSPAHGGSPQCRENRPAYGASIIQTKRERALSSATDFTTQQKSSGNTGQECPRLSAGRSVRNVTGTSATRNATGRRYSTVPHDEAPSTPNRELSRWSHPRSVGQGQSEGERLALTRSESLLEQQRPRNRHRLGHHS